MYIGVNFHSHKFSNLKFNYIRVFVFKMKETLQTTLTKKWRQIVRGSRINISKKKKKKSEHNYHKIIKNNRYLRNYHLTRIIKGKFISRGTKLFFHIGLLYTWLNIIRGKFSKTFCENIFTEDLLIAMWRSRKQPQALITSSYSPIQRSF